MRIGLGGGGLSVVRRSRVLYPGCFGLGFFSRRTKAITMMIEIAVVEDRPSLLLSFVPVLV